MKFYTTIEQSKKLLELGLSAESADMYYLRIIGESYDDYGNIIPLTNKVCQTIVDDSPRKDLHREDFPKEDVLPCCSLGALLEVMSYNISLFRATNGTYLIDDTYIVNMVVQLNKRVCEDSVIEAAYNMVVWLLENGYIKKGE